MIPQNFEVKSCFLSYCGAIYPKVSMCEVSILPATGQVYQKPKWPAVFSHVLSKAAKKTAHILPGVENWIIGDRFNRNYI